VNHNPSILIDWSSCYQVLWKDNATYSGASRPENSLGASRPESSLGKLLKQQMLKGFNICV